MQLPFCIDTTSGPSDGSNDIVMIMGAIVAILVVVLIVVIVILVVYLWR